MINILRYIHLQFWLSHNYCRIIGRSQWTRIVLRRIHAFGLLINNSYYDNGKAWKEILLRLHYQQSKSPSKYSQRNSWESVLMPSLFWWKQSNMRLKILLLTNQGYLQKTCVCSFYSSYNISMTSSSKKIYIMFIKMSEYLSYSSV